MTTSPTPAPTPAPVPAPLIPKAIIEPARPSGAGLSTKVWWLTLVCFVTAVGLTLWAQKPLGPTITIRFKDGHGIQPGNRLQHHGIEVGDVTSVTLSPEADGVIVKVMLQPQATGLAREGSQFWIVRPRFSLTKLSGLDTVVGAKYLGVQPGPTGGKSVKEFVGLETPLTVTESETVDIELRFRDGNGLTIGDPIKHRGIVVGEVSAVDLNDEFSGVVVQARLMGSATRLARAGTQFWVERPTINAAEVRGLDTLLGGRYIAVQPGSKEGTSQTRFDGLDLAPPAEVPEGGLEIVLEAARRGGLQRGVPVLYRGQRIGHVINVGLASDSASIEARAWIDGSFKHLVRENTRFWMNDGFDVSVGLKGVKLSIDTLSSLIIGGVALATPTAPGPPVKTGQRFVCAEKAEEEWLKWQPRLPLGDAAIAPGASLPKPLRASLQWQEKVFGFKRDRQKTGWVLALKNGQLLGPSDLFQVPDKAVDGAALEAAGGTWSLDPKLVQKLGHLALLKTSEPVATEAETWPSARLKAMIEPVDVLLVTSGTEPPISISASRLKATDGRWQVDPSVPLSTEQHGACVVARDDGSVIGLIVIEEGRASVALVTK